MFRAHPLFFQSIVAIGYELHQGDWFGRAAAIVFGALCVLATFELGRLLWCPRRAHRGRSLALMPYHVVVSRRVLLDGPQAFFTTITLCALIRFARSGRTLWLCAGGGLGLSVLAKEPSIIFCGAIYAFFALSPEIRIRLGDAVIALAVMASRSCRIHSRSCSRARPARAGTFVAWQLVRRPNHSLIFYLTAVPRSIGLIVCALAALSLFARARGRRWTWRETLVACWVGVPLAFLELWPVKGFQYLLPLAPVIAVLAAEGVTVVARAFASTPRVGVKRARLVVVALLLCTLAVPTYTDIAPSSKASFLAGSGGVPGGRETGRYIRAHVPEGATMLAIGPSMANILEFYGHRRAYGLSVSTNPLHRNPIYQAVPNPDLSLRRGDIQYIVWDAYSAHRSAHFERRLRAASRAITAARSTFATLARAEDGKRVRVPLIVVRGAPMRRVPRSSRSSGRRSRPSRRGAQRAGDAHSPSRRAHAGEPSFDNYSAPTPAPTDPGRHRRAVSRTRAPCVKPRTSGVARFPPASDPLFAPSTATAGWTGSSPPTASGAGWAGRRSAITTHAICRTSGTWPAGTCCSTGSSRARRSLNHLFAISATPGNRARRRLAAGGLRHDDDLRQARECRRPVAVLRSGLRPDEHHRQPR